MILHPEDYEGWLTGSMEDALALLKPFTSSMMRVVRQGVRGRSVSIVTPMD
ncbi:hypothetical protein [Tateyamaria sp.]|uniref:hypothetical protein n=1 Tax=Tateyamaria sp. TaxID=1929288 RepID=UPI00329B6AB3